jgi:hypothetical protein
VPVPVGPLELAVAIVSGPAHHPASESASARTAEEVVDDSTPPELLLVLVDADPAHTRALAFTKSKLEVVVVLVTTPPLALLLVLEVAPAPRARGQALPGASRRLMLVLVVVEDISPFASVVVDVVAEPAPAK